MVTCKTDKNIWVDSREKGVFSYIIEKTETLKEQLNLYVTEGEKKGNNRI